MSDLAGPPSGRAANGGGRAQGPVPVSQSQRSKVTPPTEIMRQRREREEAKAAAEAERQAAQRRLAGEDTPSAGERTPAGVAGPSSTQATPHRRTQSAAQPSALAYTGPLVQPSASERPTNISPSAQPTQPIDPAQSSRTRANPQLLPQPLSGSTAVPSFNPAGTSGQPSQSQPRPSGTASASQARPAASSTGPAASQRGNASSFPHAFERWETLSSHWEGLTSYWIRRLEQNTEELRREPLLQQLSRQVTDLSAAGANLFHAVVELQRLRQSSERKFQRWFHETRKEAERQQEIAAQLENALISERGARAADIQRMEAILRDQQSSKVTKLNDESKRELQISKDEARRAWEELGRREQEERERTAALREGQPILIGGIQVFPTAHQSAAARNLNTSTATTATGRPASRDGSSAPPAMSGIPAEAQPSQPSPSTTDPFIEHQELPQQSIPQPPTTNGIHSSPGHTAPAHSAAQESSFYQHPTTFLHTDAQAPPVTAASGADEDRSYVPSEEAFSSDHDDEDYEYDEHGNIRRDQFGRKILHRRGHLLSDDEELDMNDELEREHLMAPYSSISSAVQYPAIPAPTSSRANPTLSVAGPSRIPVPTSSISSGHHVAQASAYDNVEPADYEGAGYDEWERNHHHHLSRLSEIPEVDEDERSRISEASGKTPRMGPF
jgi:hypothetical protein